MVERLTGSPVEQDRLHRGFALLGNGTDGRSTAASLFNPDDRVGIVVSGTWYFGYGDSFDESKLKTLPAGSFYTEPPHANHFAMTKDEPVTIYITGTGPTGTTYANPADDPSKK